MEELKRSFLPLALTGLVLIGWLSLEARALPPPGAAWAEFRAQICLLGAAGGRWLEWLGVDRPTRRAWVQALPIPDAGVALCPESGPSCLAHHPTTHEDCAGVRSNLLPSGCIMSGMSPDSASGDDEGLVTAARTGDHQAYAGLYQRHAGWLLPTLWRLTGGDRARAEDLLQDAFVLGWQKLDQLREPAAFGGWMKRLAVNLALADRRRLRPVPDDSVPEAAAPEPPWPAADLDLELAIARLPDRARQVLVLFHLEGFTHEEIAGFMNIGTGTSKAQLHRARRLVREMLA